MSGDQRQRQQMQEERSFLGKLMESALSGNYDELSSIAQKYAVNNKISFDEVILSSKDGNKRTPLHFACLSKSSQVNGCDIVEEILKNIDKEASGSQFADFVRGKDKSGNTPLMLVCQLDNAILAESRLNILLKYGGTKQVLARAKTGATALHFAAAQGHKGLLSKLVTHGKAALHAMSSSGTPLHWAAGGGGTATGKAIDLSDTIQELIDLGAKPNLPNEQGLTPLLLAVASNSDVNASVLVKNGSDRGVILQGNVTVFHMAADLNMVKTLRALVDVSTQTSEGDENDGETTTDHASVIEKCLNLRNFENETPLDMAVKESHVECVRILMPGGESQNDLAKAKEYVETNKKSGCSKETELAKPEVTDDTNKWKKLQDKIESHSKVIIENAGSISEESKEKAAVFKAEGNKYFAQKKWSEAIDSYSKAIDINPNDATFYSNRSACFMQKDEPVMALEDGFYSRFLRPDWPKACFRISTAKLALEDYEDAAVWAWNGVTLDNKNQELKDLMQKCISKGKKSHKAKKAKESAEKKKKLTI